MKLFPRSLRYELLAWLLVPNIILWIVAGTSALYISKKLANAAYDNGLEDTLRSLSSRVKLTHGKILVDVPPAAMSLLLGDDADSEFYQVENAQGEVIAGEPDFPPVAAVSRDVSFSNADFRGTRVRVAAQKLSFPRYGDVIVQIGETMNARTAIVVETLRKIALPLMLIISLASASVVYGVGRGLRRVNQIADTVASRSFQNLTQVEEKDAPSEIQPLLGAINSLLKRLEDDVQIQRRFLSNAAHRLRTPLAGLRTQTELALRDSELYAQKPVLQQLHSGLERMTRLVKQLLALARAEPGALSSSQFVEVNLSELARSITRDLVPQALHRSIDLGFEAASESALVKGDASLLKELIANLVENGVFYTPAGGTVTVSITVGDDVVLRVEDTGPGIPQSERSKVFERFYRMRDTQNDGTGLGLAIVKEIADRHGATVSLEAAKDSSGLAAVVHFPSAAHNKDDAIGEDGARNVA